jgi:hypothetical protein
MPDSFSAYEARISNPAGTFALCGPPEGLYELGSGLVHQTNVVLQVNTAAREMMAKKSTKIRLIFGDDKNPILCIMPQPEIKSF